MKLSPQEKEAQREAFRAMSPEKKAEHIYTYYKWPILLALIALLILGSTLRRQLTKKEPVVYLAAINVSIGEDMEQQLTADFLTAAGYDARRREVYLYRGLYLSDDADTLNHEYAYASKMKLTGAISTQKLDLVLMNREGYDFLSRKGYLLDLRDWTDEQSTALLAENEVVLSDNTLEVLLGEAEEEQRVSKTVPNAFEIDSLPLFRNAGFDGNLYLGVIGNSPRLEEAASYLHFITGDS